MELLTIAADLLSDESENVEYDRAIVELTAALLGLSSDHYDIVRLALSQIKGN